jgi:hypothetical protein
MQNVLHNDCNVLIVNDICAPAGGAEYQALTKETMWVLFYFQAISKQILIRNVNKRETLF